MSWQLVTDDDGNAYYYNPETQETSWTNPDEEGTEWQELTTDDGQKYYFNSKTQVTTWDKPKEFQAVEIEADTEVNEDSVLEESDNFKTKPLSFEKEIEIEDIEPEIAASNFKKLLSDNQVDSTWTFPNVIAKFITNPIYLSVKDSLERKRLYDEYLLGEINKQLNNKTETIEKFKANFISILQDLQAKGDLDHNTRWFSVKNRLLKEENPIFRHTILSDDEIYGFFKVFQDELKDKYTKEKASNRKQALSELESYLLDINPQLIQGNEHDDWDSLYNKLLTDNRFKANKHFNVLTQNDILDLYTTKIYPKQVEGLESEIKTLESKNYTSDRIARDNFKALLKELPISADTQFDELVPIIEDEDAFIDLCGRNGSTPLDLFWDIKNEKMQILKVKVDLIEIIINELSLSLETLLRSKQEFIKSILEIKDTRLNSVNLNTDDEDNDIDLIYHELIKRYKEQQATKVKKLNRELEISRNSLVEWLLGNYQSLKIFEVIDSEEIKDSRICIINANEKYSLGAYKEEMIEEFKGVLADVESYRRIIEIIEQVDRIISNSDDSIDRFNSIDNTNTAENLNKIIKETLTSLVNKLNTRKPKRSSNFEDSDPKRRRNDKKLVINY